MALFSMRVQVIGRASGRSSIAAAAYRASEKLHDLRTGRTHDYSRKGGVIHKEILLPEDAPEWVQGISREALWQAVERHEKRKDSQTARELRIMIPREFSPEQRIAVVRDFVRESFVNRGQVADVCWHDKRASDGRDQPHAHVMLTMRFLEADGFGLKSRHEMVPDPEGRTHENGSPILVPDNPDSWNLDSYYEECRAQWERIANKELERIGSAERIDRRSYLERGIARLPQPALRLAYYLKDLRGAMRERWGQFLMAKHIKSVEDRAKKALDPPSGPEPPGERARTAERFFGWFERQLDRLAPQGREQDQHHHNKGIER